MPVSDEPVELERILVRRYANERLSKIYLKLLNIGYLLKVWNIFGKPLKNKGMGTGLQPIVRVPMYLKPRNPLLMGISLECL